MFPLDSLRLDDQRYKNKNLLLKHWLELYRSFDEFDSFVVLFMNTTSICGYKSYERFYLTKEDVKELRDYCNKLLAEDESK